MLLRPRGYPVKGFESPELSLSMAPNEIVFPRQGVIQKEGHHSPCSFIYSAPSNICHHGNLMKNKIIITYEFDTPALNNDTNLWKMGTWCPL